MRGHKIPGPDLKSVKRIFEAVEGKDGRYELNLYITGYDEDDGRRRDRARLGRHGRRQPGAEAGQPGQSPRSRPPDEGRLLARLRQPRLHARAPRRDGQDRADAGPRARRARPRVVLRRRRHRRAQPGARRHAERAHVRARPAGRERRADDEHLLDVPGRADRVPGAPRRERGLPRARQPAPRGRRAPVREGPHEQEPALAAGRGHGPRRAPLAREAPAHRPSRRPVLRLLHRPPDRPARHRPRPPARHVPAPGHRRARRHGHRVRRASTSAAASRSSR